MEAVRLLPQALQIAIAGKGMYRDSLLEMVHELDIEESVTLPGYIDSDDLPLLLNSVDAFVMRQSAELQSIATLEAMSCGKPIPPPMRGRCPNWSSTAATASCSTRRMPKAWQRTSVSSQHARALGRDGQGVAAAGVRNHWGTPSSAMSSGTKACYDR